MPKPRKSLVSLEATAYYHCVTRCVRRAFLCGVDRQSGRSFEHRRGWYEARLAELSRWFSIDLCAYAILENHTHTVLHVDSDRAATWSLRQVIEHWHGLFSGNLLSQQLLRGEPLGSQEMKTLAAVAETWRERLTSVSWFMRCLNEYIARKANAEDQCSGRFWEGRFKSQALLDESALAACMVYVDLNPIRAKMAETPEGSDYTSVKRRIEVLKESSPADRGVSASTSPSQPPELMPFVGNARQDMPKGLPFRLQDYLNLVDWTGRCIREDKRGAIPAELAPILARLQIEPGSWLYLTTRFESPFKSLVGRAHRIQRACEILGQRWAHGLRASRQLFAT